MSTSPLHIEEERAVATGLRLLTTALPQVVGWREETRPSFYGQDNGRSNQDAIPPRFGGDERLFLDAIALSQLGGNNDCAPLANFHCLHKTSGCQYVRISDSQAGQLS